MKEIAISMIEDAETPVPVKRGDLVEAWSLLENLVCSLDRIGSRHGREPGEAYNVERSRAFYEAVGRFVAEREVFEPLAEVRAKLGAYLPDEEAENFSDRIAFWHERE